MDVLFEHQVEWARAEIARIRDRYGDVLQIEADLNQPLGAGVRLMTITDPGGIGAPAAVCLTEASSEGTHWRAEVLPIPDGPDERAVPLTKGIGTAELEIRYGKCVHATDTEQLGKNSGEGGRPDLAEAVEALVTGKFKVGRRLTFGGKAVEPYSAVSAAADR